MATPAKDYTLAELIICANAAAYENDGEVLLPGIGLLPRIAASPAMKTCNTDTLMPERECRPLSEPNPLSRGTPYKQPTRPSIAFSRTLPRA